MVDAPYERIPVYVREGSIIPYGPEMQYCDEKPADQITLYVYAGRDGQFQLYEDEGVNYNYEKGKYLTIDITYNDADKTLTIGKQQGKFQGSLKQRQFNVVYVTKDQPRELSFTQKSGVLVNYSGQQVSVKPVSPVEITIICQEIRAVISLRVRLRLVFYEITARF